MTTTTAIPEKQIEFCRAVAKLAAAYGLIRLGLTYQPSYDEWSDKITLTWDTGRHGADSGRLYIASTVCVHTSVGAP